MALDLMREFLHEAHEQLDMLEQLFLGLEEGDLESIDAIFRIAHTLKGSAACVGCKPVAEFGHKMENFLEEIRQGRVAINQEICSLLLQSKDVLHILIENVEKGREDCLPADYHRVLGQLEWPVGQTDSVGPNNQGNKWLVRVALDSSSGMCAARAFVLLKRMEEIGTVEAAQPSESELVGGRIRPDEITLAVESDCNEREILKYVTGYTDVLEADVRYRVKVEEPDWQNYLDRAQALASEGKRIALEFSPGAVKLDDRAFRFIGEALRRDWLLYSKDELTMRVFRRFFIDKYQ
ncbi:MAG: hypothetical protein HPY81_08060 [Firmicutes bacterium]|nr:hypothetical protein [Bacillota bacterium]